MSRPVRKAVSEDVDFVAEAIVYVERAARKLECAALKHATHAERLTSDAVELHRFARHLAERRGRVRRAS